jgi:NhaP-type Na+/H+ or K+/H+ antiporter
MYSRWALCACVFVSVGSRGVLDKMEFTQELIELFVGACIGSFGLGFALAFILKWFKQIGEKI